MSINTTAHRIKTINSLFSAHNQPRYIYMWVLVFSVHGLRIFYTVYEFLHLRLALFAATAKIKELKF